MLKCNTKNWQAYDIQADTPMTWWRSLSAEFFRIQTRCVTMLVYYDMLGRQETSEL
jgi:hypothetical protein